MANNDTALPGWRIELFGVLRASTADRSIDRFLTKHTATLLALLALSPNRRLPREELIDALWPDVEPESSRARLSRILGWLRAELEPRGLQQEHVLLSDRQSVGLDAARFTTDVGEFESLLAQARRARTSSEKIPLLEQATALYRGDLLPGHYDDWILTQRRQLLGDLLVASNQLIDLLERQGDIARALDYARRVLSMDPADEEAHHNVIRLLAASAQPAGALRQYQELQRILEKEFKAQPSATTTALAAQIRQAVSSPRPSAALAPVPASNIPNPLTRFFGRDEEMRRLRDLLGQQGARLLTLTGMGGSGKTRLAIEAARQLASDHGKAAFFVPLADIEDDALVIVRIAAALELPQTSAIPATNQVLSALARAPHLLVLDNLEHLIPAASSVVRDLLERVPNLTLIVTSRQRLGLDGEREMLVEPLMVPPAVATPEQLLAYPSVNLFVDRVQAVRATFELSERNASYVARLCERLEGIPLAIELCAAWAQTITTAQMLEQISDRFDLLVSRRADITPRHRTLRAALEYSYLQLPVGMQERFACLSLFRGGWSLTAADAICANLGGDRSPSALTVMTELRERSLILAEEVGDEMRYRMLETLREFAAAQLSYARQVERHRIHASYFTRLAEQAEVGLTGAQQDRWLARLDHEQENIRAAVAWCIESKELELALRLASALHRYWHTRGRLSEGRECLDRLLAMVAQSDPCSRDAQHSCAETKLLAKSWNAAGYLAWSQSDYTAAREAHERSLILRRASSDRPGIAESLYHLGITAYRQGSNGNARELLSESLLISRDLADQPGIGRALLNLGNIALAECNLEESKCYYEQSYAIEKSLGNRQRIADSLNNLGLVARESHCYPIAARHLNEALAIRRELNDKYGAAIALSNLATIARLTEDWDRAWSFLASGLALAHEVGNKHILAYFFMEISILVMRDGPVGDGVFLVGAAQSLIDSVGMTFGSSALKAYEEILTAARNDYCYSFPDAWADGRHAEQSEVVARALCVANAGRSSGQD